MVASTIVNKHFSATRSLFHNSTALTGDQKHASHRFKTVLYSNVATKLCISTNRFANADSYCSKPGEILDQPDNSLD